MVSGADVSALGWLAWINLLLGGFNLIPAAPLDGGRVLRATLWRSSGDRVRAATTAARAGEVFGYVLVILGVLEFLTVGLIGLWFVFLGWFLLSAARSEENAVVMRSSLADVHVRDIMTRDPVTFASTTTVADLIDNQLHRYRFSSYPLVGPDGRLEGLTTMGRIRHVAANLRPTTRLIDIACPLSEVPVGAHPTSRFPTSSSACRRHPMAGPSSWTTPGNSWASCRRATSPGIVQLSMLRSRGRAARRY